MNTQSSKSINLSRTNYGESDRVLRVITEDGNKVALMAKGVRKLKSKMAGGIELFCECNLVYLGSKDRMGTLVSARVDTQYANIVKDMERTMFGYEILKLVNKVTEDDQIADYYRLLSVTLSAINSLDLDLNMIIVWTYYNLLEITGHRPNFLLDTSGEKLKEGNRYDFDIPTMSMVETSSGQYNSGHIKFLRVVERTGKPTALSRISGAEQIASDLADLFSKMIKFNL